MNQIARNLNNQFRPIDKDDVNYYTGDYPDLGKQFHCIKFWCN